MQKLQIKFIALLGWQSENESTHCSGQVSYKSLWWGWWLPINSSIVYEAHEASSIIHFNQQLMRQGNNNNIVV